MATRRSGRMRCQDPLDTQNVHADRDRWEQHLRRVVADLRRNSHQTNSRTDRSLAVTEVPPRHVGVTPYAGSVHSSGVTAGLAPATVSGDGARLHVAGLRMGVTLAPLEGASRGAR